jgi:hypothetical protein
MKKIACLALLCFAIPSQSQENKIPYGTYSSSQKGEKIKFSIKPDNTFEMSFFTGKIIHKNDSIFMESESLSGSNFGIVKKGRGTDEKLQLTFTKESYLSYYSNKVYIGTQDEENGPVNYKSAIDYFPETAEEQEKEYAITIDRAKYLYLVHEDIDSKTSTVYKFEVAKDINSLEIEYNPFAKADTKLFATYDSKTQELKISDGKSPISFVLESDTNKETPDNSSKPVSVKTVKNWNYPGKKIPEAMDATVDSANVDYSANAAPPFIFALKMEKSFSESLKAIQKQKGKFLAVFVDFSKEAPKKFKEFVTAYESNAGNSMYDTYNPEYDKFNFYLANTKDKNIPKNISTKEPHLLIFNEKGTLLYFEKGIRYTDSNFIYSANTIASEISNAHYQALLDYAATVKISSKEKKEILQSVSSHYIFPDTPLPEEAIPAVQVQAVEENTAAEGSALSIDTPSSVANDWELLKEKRNFYDLKSTPESLKNLWKTIFNDYKKQPLDMTVASIGLKELQGNGFSKVVFNRTPEALNAFDFEVLDYLIRNGSTIASVGAAGDTYNVETPYIYDIRNDVFSILDDALADSRNSQATKDKTLEYYSKWINMHPKEYYSFKKYQDRLKENQKLDENITVFQQYLSGIITDNSSIIEQLDKTYSQQTFTEEWASYKANFSNLSNENAWTVVENKNLHQKPTLEKAIHWSEISLQIEKNNGYYLDTLAQLYYINGDKQKGIATQENALKNFSKDNDPEVFEKMKETFEKMKNGSY